jgi:hypothetical protein
MSTFPFRPTSPSSSRRTRPFRIALCLLAWGSMFAAQPAASRPKPVSWAFGERIQLQVAPLFGGGIVLQSQAQPLVSVTATGTRVLNAPQAVLAHPLLGNILTTGLLTVRATATDENAGSAGADASVLNLGLRLPGALPLLTISADKITSTASLSGICTGDVAATGVSGLGGLVLGGLLGGGIRVPSTLPPNTVLLDSAGLRLIVNEQILEVADDAPILFTVNALHLSIAGAASALGVLSGEMIVAQSHTAISCGGEVLPPQPSQQ